MVVQFGFLVGQVTGVFPKAIVKLELLGMVTKPAGCGAEVVGEVV